MHDIKKHITPRLEMIISLVPKSRVICDIGTDHGYIPIYLAKDNRAKRIIASDVNEGPLSYAQKNIESFLVKDKVETRLSDGFSGFKYGEAETCIISGMGGELIAKILKTDIGIKNFVLQPQTMHRYLREYLCENGFEIKKEAIAREDKKMYVALLATRGKSPSLTETELEIGPCLIREKPPLFHEYVKYRLYEIDSILKKMGEGARKKGEKYILLKNEYEKLIEDDKND